MGEKETEKERRDRELLELLNELRVALPGVQVLFAFLLVVPFSQGYPAMTSNQKTVYFASFMCTATSSIFLIAPTVYHRIQFRAHDKESLLITANTLAIVGTFFLALAIGGVVFVITDFLYGSPQSLIATAVIAALFLTFWFALPLRRKLSSNSD